MRLKYFLVEKLSQGQYEGLLHYNCKKRTLYKILVQEEQMHVS